MNCDYVKPYTARSAVESRGDRQCLALCIKCVSIQSHAHRSHTAPAAAPAPPRTLISRSRASRPSPPLGLAPAMPMATAYPCLSRLSAPSTHYSTAVSVNQSYTHTPHTSPHSRSVVRDRQYQSGITHTLPRARPRRRRSLASSRPRRLPLPLSAPRELSDPTSMPTARMHALAAAQPFL